MNPGEANSGESMVRAALRRMADAAPRGASAETGRALMSEFRAHHARRRQLRLLRTAALGACAAAAIAFAVPVLISVKGPAVPGVARPAAAGVTAIESAEAIPVVEEPVREPLPAPRPAGTGRRAHRTVSRRLADTRQSPAAQSGVAGVSSAAAGDFVLLPSFDPSLAASPLQVVRLEMPGTDLNLVGIPVSESGSGLRVVADVMIGYDGRPYAVRLVRAVR